VSWCLSASIGLRRKLVIAEDVIPVTECCGVLVLNTAIVTAADGQANVPGIDFSVELLHTL